MKIEKLLKQLDAEMVKKYDSYLKLHEELNKHRGKKFEDTDLPIVNNLLKKIQLQFHELYPALHFITFRNESSVNTINEYNYFIEDIKTHGATEQPISELH